MRKSRYRSVKNRPREKEYRDWAQHLFDDTLESLKLDKLREICKDNNLPKSGNKSRLAKRIKDNLTFCTHEFLKNEKTVFIKCYKYDYISECIRLDKNFYEWKILDNINDLSLNPGVLVDIGGHVGNHSLFFLMFSSIEKSYIFEPRRDLCDLIKHNAKLNNLEKNVELNYRGVKAIADRKGKFDFLRKKDFNLGTGKILIKEKGDVPVDTVDNLFKEISVAVMKIDVEGLEETVLKGAKSTIQRDTPVIIVESNVKSKEDSDHTKGLDEILDRLKPTKYEVFYRDGAIPGPFTYILKPTL